MSLGVSKNKALKIGWERLQRLSLKDLEENDDSPK